MKVTRKEIKIKDLQLHLISLLYKNIRNKMIIKEGSKMLRIKGKLNEIQLKENKISEIMNTGNDGLPKSFKTNI